MTFATGFLVGAVTATLAPLVGALLGAVLHERNLRTVWEDWE